MNKLKRILKKKIYTKEDLQYLVEIAYKKLKSYVYHKNDDMFLRNRIAEFELDENFESELVNLADEVYSLLKRNDIVNLYKNEEEGFYDELKSKILLEEFKFKCLPKEIKVETDEEEDGDIICNFIDEKKIVLDRLTYFIDIDVKAQILGTLWVILNGGKLEAKYDNYAYANRLDDLYKERTLELFKPYFLQYEKWRNNGIKLAEGLINQKKKAFIFSLDIKDYYYSVDMDFNQLEKDLGFDEEIKIEVTTESNQVGRYNLNVGLTKFIEGVIQEYSGKLGIKNKSQNIDRIALPIGFIPSCIISNWYLAEFDKSVIESLNPIYYGRYVDDIIIVLNNNLKSKSNSVKQVMKKYFEHNNLICFSQEDNQYKISLKKDKNEDEDELVIQNDKIKIYNFHPDGSEAILKNFKKELEQNASIFKFLPNREEIIEEFEKNVYEIKYTDNISKLRSIGGVKLNKYNLSKYLARIIFTDKLEGEEDKNNINKQIMSIFKGYRCIDLYSLWEKVLAYFLISEQKDTANEFIEMIFKNLEDILMNGKVNKDNNQNYTVQTKDEDLKKQVYESLMENLKIIIGMMEALNNQFLNLNYEKLNKVQKEDQEYLSDFIDEKFSDIKEDKVIDDIKNLFLGIPEIRKSMLKSNMIRHNYISEPLLNYINLVSDFHENCIIKKVNLIKPGKIHFDSYRGFRCPYNNNAYIEYTQNEKKEIPNKCQENPCNQNKTPFQDEKCMFELNERALKYTPRFIHLHEFILFQIKLEMAHGKIINGVDYLKKANRRFNDINFKEEPRGRKEGYSSDEDEIVKNEWFTIADKDQICEKYDFNKNDYLFTQQEYNINFVETGLNRKLNKVKIGICHIDIEIKDITDSVLKTPKLDKEKLNRIFNCLNKAVKKNVDIIILPEIAVPIDWLPVISNFSRNHQVAIICGIEHVTYENNITCNYLAQILPFKDDFKGALVKLRLKNHYSPNEERFLKGYERINPNDIRKAKENNSNYLNKFKKKEYDLISWNGVWFSTYNCFELANIRDRSLFMSYVDLLIGIVHNKDLGYYSNIIESLSRDVHCYFVQANNLRYGDSRITQPTKSATKDIVRIIGGYDDIVITGEIDVKKLRDFQIMKYDLQIGQQDFKVTPPEFKSDNVKIRENMPL